MDLATLDWNGRNPYEIRAHKYRKIDTEPIELLV